jgi:hypothetical protein
MTFEPVTNERFANIAGVHYDQEEVIPGKVIYSRTHTVKDQWDVVAGAGPCVLITSFSDQTVTDEDAEKLPDNVVQWFTTNCQTDDRRVRSIPIGFVYNHIREKAMMTVIKEGELEKKNVLYVCFNNRHLGGRQELWDRFQGVSWATCKENVEPEEYYRDIAEHHYILSPPGAGPDCHRHWESVALGSLPIVKVDETIIPLGCYIPISDWDYVTLNNLMTIYDEESQGLSEVPEWFGMEYWRKEIGSWVKNL